jgi:hypothetical protein
MTGTLLLSSPDSVRQSWKVIGQGGQISKRQATHKREQYYAQAGMSCLLKSMELLTRNSYTAKFREECSNNFIIRVPAMAMDVHSTVLHSKLAELKTLRT